MRRKMFQHAVLALEALERRTPVLDDDLEHPAGVRERVEDAVNHREPALAEPLLDTKAVVDVIASLQGCVVHFRPAGRRRGLFRARRPAAVARVGADDVLRSGRGRRPAEEGRSSTSNAHRRLEPIVERRAAARACARTASPGTRRPSPSCRRRTSTPARRPAARRTRAPPRTDPTPRSPARGPGSIRGPGTSGRVRRRRRRAIVLVRSRPARAWSNPQSSARPEAPTSTASGVRLRCTTCGSLRWAWSRAARTSRTTAIFWSNVSARACSS